MTSSYVKFSELTESVDISTVIMKEELLSHYKQSDNIKSSEEIYQAVIHTIENLKPDFYNSYNKLYMNFSR